MKKIIQNDIETSGISSFDNQVSTQGLSDIEQSYRSLALEGLELRVLEQYDLVHDDDGNSFVDLGNEHSPCFIEIHEQPSIQILYLFAEVNGIHLCPCEMEELIESLIEYALEFGEPIDVDENEDLMEEVA